MKCARRAQDAAARASGAVAGGCLGAARLEAGQLTQLRQVGGLVCGRAAEVRAGCEWTVVAKRWKMRRRAPREASLGHLPSRNRAHKI